MMAGLTQEQAQQRVCPNSLISEEVPSCCLGENCMAWRWSRERETKKFIRDVAKRMKETGEMYNKAMQHVIKESGGAYKHTEGYCGLAGRPE